MDRPRAREDGTGVISAAPPAQPTHFLPVPLPRRSDQWIWMFPLRRTPDRSYPVPREIESVSEPAPDDERSSTTTTKFVNVPSAKPVPLIVAFIPPPLPEEMPGNGNVGPPTPRRP